MKVRILTSVVVLTISLFNCFIDEEVLKMLLIGNSATAGVELVRNYFSLLFSLILIIILVSKYRRRLIIVVCVLLLWLFCLFTKAIDEGNNRVYYGITFIEVYERNLSP
jgi:hypothetical protein